MFVDKKCEKNKKQQRQVEAGSSVSLVHIFGSITDVSLCIFIHVVQKVTCNHM